jgi:cell division protein FtsQ
LIPDKPILSGWTDKKARILLSDMTRSMVDVERIHLADLSEIVPLPSKAYPDKIQIFTNSGYRVITTIKKFPKYISYLQEVVEKLQAEEKMDGYIYMLESIYHQPLKQENTGKTSDRAESAANEN